MYSSKVMDQIHEPPLTSTKYFSNPTGSSVISNFPEPLNLDRLCLKLNYLVAMHDEWHICMLAFASWTKATFGS